jgi:hypothetical protein
MTLAAGVLAATTLTSTGNAWSTTEPMTPAPAPPQGGSRVAASAPTSAYLAGTSCRAFPADSWWHADVSRLPVHPRSAAWLSHMQVATRRLHADFGPSFGAQPVPYGIPITVVNGAPRVPVTFGYPAESDRVRYPLGTATRIEGGSAASGDRHAIVVDKATCTLFETWDTHRYPSGWYAGSGAVWRLTSDALRPATWTSADAAGLPILPGLLRYEEVAAGRVDHAIRFTTSVTDRTLLWPARHQAGSVSNRAYPPMGARFRLRASYPIASFTAQEQVVLRAMNGSPWFFQGTSDSRWTARLVSDLGRVPASAFEAVDTAPLMISPSSGAARRL